jgi:hypothetical protein
MICSRLVSSPHDMRMPTPLEASGPECSRHLHEFACVTNVCGRGRFFLKLTTAEASFHYDDAFDIYGHGHIVTERAKP